MTIIYKITNSINGKVYVGKTIKSLHHRWLGHVRHYKNNVNRHLYDSMRKHGIDCFSITEIERCDDIISGEREKYWIGYYNSKNREFGYNMADGGLGGYIGNEAMRRVADKIRGRKLTQEHKNKISMSNRGISKPVSNETRIKISNTHKERIKSGEIKKPTVVLNVLMAGGKLGFFQHHSDETKQKLSRARKGKKYEDVMSAERACIIKKNKSKNWIGCKNPNYKTVDKDVLRKYIEGGLTLRQIANKLNVGLHVIRKCVIEFWDCNFLTSRSNFTNKKYIRKSGLKYATRNRII